jgi:CheY-like chemotaxis protein
MQTRSARDMDKMTAETRPILIAVVEDNPADVVLVREALRSQKLRFELMKFEDSDEAIEALCPSSGKPEIRPDLVLIDLNLAQCSGFEVLRALRQPGENSGVPAAILTSSESPRDQKQAMALGATRYILKPTRLEEFLEKVGTAIREMLPGSG